MAALKTLALAAGALIVGAVPALAATRDTPHSPCFFLSEWRGWKSPDPNTLYLGVNMRDVYEVKLSGGSSQLQWPDMHLVSVNRGSSSICSALDLDLKIADTNGFAEPLIARSLRKMSPEEAAAIPRKFRPN